MTTDMADTIKLETHNSQIIRDNVSEEVFLATRYLQRSNSTNESIAKLQNLSGDIQGMLERLEKDYFNFK